MYKQKMDFFIYLKAYKYFIFIVLYKKNKITDQIKEKWYCLETCWPIIIWEMVFF